MSPEFTGSLTKTDFVRFLYICKAVYDGDKSITDLLFYSVDDDVDGKLTEQ